MSNTYKYKNNYSVLIDLNRRGDGMGSGYTCKVIDKNNNVIFEVTPVGSNPEDSFETLMTSWNYYMGNN